MTPDPPPLNLTLGSVHVRLETTSPLVAAEWQLLFADHSDPVPADPDIVLRLVEQPALPSVPGSAPLFVDRDFDFPDNVGALSVYADAADDLWLHFRDGALVRVWHAGGDGPLVADGIITTAIVRYGRFEDVTFVALAPLLRRFEHYLLHASAAALDGRAALFIGRSGSGKTTTCLNLVTHGWHLLANDVVLLRAAGDRIHAWPTPNEIGIRPHTLTLLPQLRPHAVRQQQIARPYFRLPDPAAAGIAWGAPQPIGAVFFVEVGSGPTRFTPLRAAVTLARLMEQSLDTWDGPTLVAHTACLQQLAGHAPGYRLQLGDDVAALPGRLAALLAGEDSAESRP